MEEGGCGGRRLGGVVGGHRGRGIGGGVCKGGFVGEAGSNLRSGLASEIFKAEQRTCVL